MVDYKKWDSLCVSDEEGSGDELVPRVTRLSEGKSITIGPKGASIVESVSQAMKPISSNNSEWCKNGAKFDNYMWSQDRKEVVLRIVIADTVNVKGSELKVIVKGKQLIVRHKDRIIFEKVLKYEIDKSTYDVNNGVIDDWELMTCDHLRLLVITFTKLSPIPNAFIWWKCCFEGDSEIDVSAIPGRTSNFNFAAALKEAESEFSKNHYD